METLTAFLAQQPLLALFLVIASGYALGAINVKGLSLGVGAVLFSGLFIGAIAPKAQPPPLVGTLGLVMFLYGLGIQFGKQFFAGLAGQGRAEIQPAGGAGTGHHDGRLCAGAHGDGRVPRHDGRAVRRRGQQLSHHAGGAGSGGEQRSGGGLQRGLSLRAGRRDPVHLRDADHREAEARRRASGHAHGGSGAPIAGGHRAAPARPAADVAFRGERPGRARRERELSSRTRHDPRRGRCPAAWRRGRCAPRVGADDARRGREGARRQRSQPYGHGAGVRVEAAPGRRARLRPCAARRRGRHDHPCAAWRHRAAGDVRADAGDGRPGGPADPP